MKFLNHNLFTGDITVNGTTTLSTATGITRATGDNSTHLATTAFVKAQGYATTAALSGYVPTSRTLTINGTTYDLSANRSWTISSADGYISNVQVVGSTLSFTGVGSAFSGVVDLSTLIPTVRTVYETVKNVSGATILKGTPLAVVAGQTSGNVSDVVPADAADPTKMPAVFIANENIADEAEGEAVLFGNITGINTSAFTSGTTVYVAPGGGWTATKPVHPNLIQNLGVITKQHATNGGGIVTGVGRANALPNLTAGKIWVGSASYPIESTTVHVDEANARVGIGTTAPLSSLDVRGNISLDRNRYIYFGGQGNTGEYIYESTPGTIAIHAGGSDALFFPNNNSFIYTPLALGVGTSSPTYKLDVATGNDNAIRILNSAGSNNNGLALSVGSGTPWLDFYGGRFDIKYNTSPGSWNSGANIFLSILSSGNVGIGTTAPSSKLHVYQSNSEGIYLDGLQEYTTFKMLYGGNQKAEVVYQYSTDQMYFNKFGTGTFAFYGGSVGIGTGSPSEKLHVDGRVRIATIDNGAGDFATISGTGVITRRTAAQVLSDIGAQPSGSYLTAESDTLATVTARGASTNTSITVGPDLVIQADGGVNYTASRLKLNSHNNYRGAGMHLTGVDSNWFVGTPYTDFAGGFVIARKGTAASFEDTAQYSNALFTVKSDGNVGIGTTNMYARLNVKATSHNNGISVNRAADNTAALYIGNDGGTIPIIASNNADLIFGRDFSGTFTERMRMTNDGNFGIGTTSPNAKLEVNGNIKLSSTAGSTATPSNIWLGNDYSNGTTRDKLKIYLYNSGTEQYGFSVGPTSDVQYHSNILHDFYVANSLKVRINGSGNLGIGTASPIYKLDVAGAIRLTGSLVFDDLTSNLIQHRAGTDVNTLVTVGHGGFDHNGYLRIGGVDVATQTYVNTAIANLVDSAPSTLDTLNELAAALGDDPNFATTVTNSIATKLPLAGGTMTGQILTPSIGTGVYDGAIQLREYAYVNNTQTAWGYSPAITFHWGNITVKRFGMRSDGQFAIDDAPLALQSWVTSQGYTTNTGTVTSVSGTGGYGGLTLSGTVTSSGNITLGGTPTGTWPISVSGNAATATSATSATSATQVVTLQDDAPTGVNGKLWWETDTGKLKVYYGASSAWVDALPMPDMTLYLSTAGGAISGDLSIAQTLTVTGNILSSAVITASGGNSTQWNTAYGWGNHASAGYLTSYTETDTLATVTARGSSTNGSIYVNGLLTGGLGAATTSGTLDWNDSSNARAGQGYTLLLGSHTNGPGPGEYFHPVGFEYGSKDGSGNVTQLAISYGSPGDKMYMRGRYSGSWTGWTQFITSANIGSQSVNYASSAGNADTLDSLDSTNFMRSYGMLNNTDVYVNFRVIQNNNSSSANDGLYIGYNNSNSGVTRIFGGGATSGGLVVGGAGVNDVSIAGNTVWNSGNDGAGSGLDADLLDGQHASAFAAASHNHDDRYYTETESDARYPLSRGTLGTTTNVGDSTGFGNNLASGTYTRNYVGHSGQVWMSHDTGGSTGNFALEVTYYGAMYVHTNVDSSSWVTKQIWTAENFTSTNITNWNTAYGWGNHAGLYLGINSKAADSELLDGVDESRFVYGNSNTRRGTNLISNWNQTNYPDVAFLSAENGGTNAPSSDYSYGMQYSFHRSGAAYRTQFVTSLYSDLDIWVRNSRDSDVWTSWKRLWHSGDFSSTNVSNWNTAYGWGNHASAGYITGYTETDTLATVTGRGASTTNAITVGGATINGTWETNISTTGGWSKLSFVASNAWGDGATYGVLGAGGGAEPGVMTYNQHATWVGSSNGAGIRMGRSGGVASGAWYQVATMDSDEFMIAKNGQWSNGGIKITSGGELQHGNSGNKYWHAGNDGPGSGLDADLWDGYHVGQFSNWNSRSANDIVTGMMSWRNYGNSHVIFDASNSISPSGGAVNNTNSDIPWTGTYPTLMGWNGTNTYGVRVDSARSADVAGNANTLGGWQPQEYIPYHSGSDFVDGTLVVTNIDASVTNGDSFVMELTGKSYGSGPAPFALLLEGYIYNNTFINTGAISYGSWFPAPIKVLNYNGNLAFWWARGSYWNSFSVTVREAGGSSRNRVTSISNSTEPSSAKKVSVNVIQSLNSNNYNSWVPTLTGGGASGTWGINISGNATTATNVAWTGVTAGRRTNYNLGFEAPSTGYAGFSFTTPGGAAENAGYFLIRGGADSDVYTQNGITLVADQGWLTLAQRTTAGKGVRIMSGTTSAERLKINTDGTIEFVNGAGFTYNSNTIWHAGNDGAGSGLDADLLDGNHASAFYLASNPSGYISSYTETNTFLGDGGNADTHPGTSRLIFTGQVSAGVDVLGMPATDNSNAFLNINRHPGEYNSQLGFSSNGSMYYRSFSATAINSTQAWRQVWDSGNLTNLNQLTNGPGYITGNQTITLSGDVSGSGTTSISVTVNSATSATQVVTIQDTPPTGANGKLWWESDTGKLKVYYGSSSAWVDATPVPDMSLYYAKAGGPISGDVTIQQTLTVVGNTLIQGTLTETSDISLKENIVPLESSLDKVMQLNGVSFNKKATPNVKEIGFIAQEVEAVIPDLVTETSEGIKTVSYSRVTAVLVETIKEQQAQIEELKNMVNMLAEKLNNL